VKTYTGVINAFSKLQKNDRVGHVVMELFEEMKALDADPTSKIRLDSFAFVTVLRALENADTQQSNRDACRVLSSMLDLHSSGRRDLKTDGRSLSIAITVLAQCGQDAASVGGAIDLFIKLLSRIGEVRHPPLRDQMRKLARRWKSEKVISNDTFDNLMSSLRNAEYSGER